MICELCGYNNEENKHCNNCGAVLEPAPSDEQLAELLNRLSDPLIASSFDKKIKWLFFISAVAIVPIITLFSRHNIFFGILAALLSALAGVVAGYPKILWKSEKSRIKKITDIDTTPNSRWGISRKISYWVLYIYSIAFMFMLIYN